MIDKFGKVMIYVNNPRDVADFWIQQLKFTERNVQRNENGIFSVEIAPGAMSDTSIVLFDKEFVRQMSPEISMNAPSILFASHDVEEMRNELIKAGVVVGEIVVMGTVKTFNFSDIEGNYFAVEEISAG